MDGCLLEFVAKNAERISMKFCRDVEHTLKEHMGNLLFLIPREQGHG